MSRVPRRFKTFADDIVNLAKDEDCDVIVDDIGYMDS